MSNGRVKNGCNVAVGSPFDNWTQDCNCPWKYSKNFFREIAYLTVSNFFPVQKLLFGHFGNGKKWIFVKKNFFVKLIYLISPKISRVFWPGRF